MADGVQVDVPAVEPQQAFSLPGEVGLHIDVDVEAQVDAHLHRFLRDYVPVLRTLHQQALQGQIEQRHLPAQVALADLRAGVEGDALEAPALVVIVSHVVALRPFLLRLTIDRSHG